jgi:hypothetical protein
MTNDNNTIDYAAYVDTAMRGAVRDILKRVERSGLPGQHHFFISFRTTYPGVSMSDLLRSKYPQEITIVIQHQFSGLSVEQDLFRVTLSFNNIPEKLVVPYAALTGFADPSTKFGLQFHSEQPEAPPVKTPVFENTAAAEEDDDKGSAEIITLDAFRKK